VLSEPCSELRKALKLLTELNNLVWTNPGKVAGKGGAPASNGLLTDPAGAITTAAGPPGALTLAMPTEAGQQQQQDGSGKAATSTDDDIEKLRKAHETQCEKLLTDVYQSTFKVKEYAGLSDNEWYICNIAGHPFFLPFLVKNGAFRRMWKGCKTLVGIQGRLGAKRWKLSKDDVEDMAGSIRRMARLLRMVHLEYMEVSALSACLPVSGCIANANGMGLAIGKS
jgi:hypothetical protein